MITNITFKPCVYVNSPLTGQFGVHQNYSTKPNIYQKSNQRSPFLDTVSFSGNEKKLTSQSLSDKEFKALVGQKVKQATPATKMDVASELTEVLDLYLQGKWDDKVQPHKKKTVLAGLKKLMGEQGQGNIVMAQINPIPGNVEANAKKAMAYIRAAEAIGADTVVFSELTLMGYPIHDTIDRHPVIVKENMDWLQEIAKQTGKTKVMIGFVEPRENLTQGETVGKAYYNSVATLGDGKVLGVTRKSLLPTYSEFNDYRYIEPSPVTGNQPPETLGHFGRDKITEANKLNEIHGHNYGVVICEDGWNDKDFFKNGVLYEVDPVAEVAKAKPDMIINCSASPSRAKKEQLKHNMLSYSAQKHGTPMVYVNQVGAIDDSSFDGASRVYNANGELVARAKSFEEQFMVVNPLKSQGKTFPLAKGLEKTLKEQKVFSLDYEPDLDRTYKTIVQGTRDYFNKNGLKRAVLGLSGGLDSTVSAVLLADALGPKNVYGISMPSKITSEESRSDAKILAENLGIHFDESPIKGMVTSANEQLEPLFDRIAKNWDGRYTQSFVQDNIQARSRATLLWGICNAFGQTISIATSDKSELYMGYATINGDMSGGFAPIADVPKTKLFALARWMNENRDQKGAIPEAIIAKPPGAELAIDPKTLKPLVAEDALMPYEFLDEVIWRIENKHESYTNMIGSKFLYEKGHDLSKEQKTIWLDRFYKRMSSALFKWTLLPPSVIVEGRSINKGDYRQPVASGSIDYKGQVIKTIAKKLKQIK
ncbi:MAG: NAD(+) synthase [Candidatus Gastranaerophilaceae bacterium]